MTLPCVKLGVPPEARTAKQQAHHLREHLISFSVPRKKRVMKGTKLRSPFCAVYSPCRQFVGGRSRCRYVTNAASAEAVNQVGSRLCICSNVHRVTIRQMVRHFGRIQLTKKPCSTGYHKTLD